MPTFSVQRGGYTRVPELFYSIVTDLIANGFSLKFPSSPLQAPVAGQDYAKFKATLEVTAASDPIAGTQPWRIQFDCSSILPATSDQIGNVYVASPLQLPNDGTTALLDTNDGSGTTANEKLPAGMLNTMAKMPVSTGVDDNNAAYNFINRYSRLKDKATAISYPMTYRLTTTDHGIALAVWEDGTEEDITPQFSWFVVQRPVNHTTGIPLQTGHCPMFCLFGMVSKVSKFVVREDDVLRPTKSVAADIDSEDSRAIINTKAQVSITENNRYVMTFPNGLNTPRYMYTEELDLIAYTSADVVSQYSDVPITAYGEATPRKYKALHANGKYNTGMRIMLLTEGGSKT